MGQENMETKWKILVIVALITSVSALGFFGYSSFKKQKVSNSKATVINPEEIETNKVGLEENIQTENIEMVKEESSNEDAKEAEEESKESSKISLSGKTTSKGVALSWSVSNLGNYDGFKIVKSKEANPTYPGSEYVYLSNKESRSYSWNFTSGSKYHFRVCEYSGGKCLLYSNDIILDTREKGDDDDGEYATSVSLSLVEDDGDKYLKWTISGGDAPKGYKVVKSKDKNPEYPDDGYYKYISNGDTKKVELEGFDDDDEYHFRVCIYKGGSCGAYSNDIKVSF